MTDTKTTQPAVDATDTTAQPVVEGNDARTDGDELDTLLQEYDAKTAPPAPAATQPEQRTGTDTISRPPTDPAITEVQQYIFRQDMAKTVATVRGDMPAEQFDDTIVRAWINARADEDPRLAQAWINRHSNPKQFERVVAGLGREFGKRYSKAVIDRTATDDRAAVTDAVRSASTRAPESKPTDYSQMSNQEFREAHKREHGYYPPV